ncbi:MAG: serine/threonine protein kinase [Planctomycetes bacterium]|jgi:serine/threonine-protein kinase|nr:serine/threonine protein kinase [Planctomycetota bacterium]
MGAKSENLFGRIALKHNLVTPKQLVECLAVKDKLRREGKDLMLGQILLERGYLTKEEVLFILKAQKKAVLECPVCKTRYNVEGFGAGHKVKCRMCRTVLEVPREPDTIVVDRTIWDSKTQIRDPMIGKMVGNYRVESKLGEGGQSQVYLACHVGLDRKMAMKLLPISSRTTQAEKERFIREARIVARLTHPNVVQVFDVGEDKRHLYLAMEYVEGDTLEDVMTERKILPVPEATGIVHEVAQALKAAHAEGIVHRDIKPDNIMLNKTGVVKVTDFGLAITQERGKKITRVGMILGTPYYISPDQVQGRELDIRSDIYSLGASYYYFVTGRRPFEEGTPAEIMLQHIEDAPVPPDYVNPHVPREVNDIILKMMAKEPAERYQDPQALIAAVEPLPRTKPVVKSDAEKAAATPAPPAA